MHVSSCAGPTFGMPRHTKVNPLWGGFRRLPSQPHMASQATCWGGCSCKNSKLQGQSKSGDSWCEELLGSKKLVLAAFTRWSWFGFGWVGGWQLFSSGSSKITHRGTHTHTHTQKPIHSNWAQPRQIQRVVIWTNAMSSDFETTGGEG